MAGVRGASGVAGVSIRIASAGDGPVWRDLWLRALAQDPAPGDEPLAEARTRDAAAWRALLAPRHDAARLLARRDGQPVGLVEAALDHDARRARLARLWVAPEARRAGVGMALCDAALAWARGCAALDISAGAGIGQAAARALLARAGFAPRGERPSLVVRGGEPGELLTRRLPPLVMGVVNVTPDSFSDGGAYLDPGAAVAHGLALRAEGADVLDVGGEATNPRATAVSVAEELRRVLPVIEGLAASGARVSVDTTKAEVARAAVAAGATIVNDVSGGLFDPEMAAALAGLARSGSSDLTYIAGHLRGRTLAEVFDRESFDLGWQTVAAELAERLVALPAGVRVWIDPGIGFGKGADPACNVGLVEHAGDMAAELGRPIVIGVSRKRFLRRLLGVAEPGRDVLDAASALASLAAIRAGAQVVRVHNVTLLRTALTAYNKM